MKKKQAFRAEVLELDFETDYYRKFVRNLAIEFVLEHMVNELELEMRRIEIPVKRIVDDVVENLLERDVETVNTDIVEEYFINYILQHLPVKEKRRMLSNAGFSYEFINSCTEVKNGYKKYVKELKDEEIEAIDCIFSFMSNYIKHLRDASVKDNMRTQKRKSADVLKEKLSELKVDKAYYRVYIRNMVSDYLKNGMDTEIFRYFLYIEPSMEEFVSNAIEILLDLAQDDVTWDLMEECVHNLMLKWLDEDTKIEFLLQASTIEDDSVYKEYANFLYDQEQDMIAKCVSVSEMEAFFLRGIE